MLKLQNHKGISELSKQELKNINGGGDLINAVNKFIGFWGGLIGGSPVSPVNTKYYHMHY